MRYNGAIISDNNAYAFQLERLLHSSDHARIGSPLVSFHCKASGLVVQTIYFTSLDESCQSIQVGQSCHF